jgi:TIGR02646 family protein
MKQIFKTNPPSEFVDYCKTPGVSFSTLSSVSKRALKEHLLKDQGYICCYCGCEILNNEGTKIEHIKCQKRHPDLALCFDNMLASCDGGDKDRRNKVKPPHLLHCDAKKGNDDIPISPLDKNIEKQIIYFDDGAVIGRGEEGKELIKVLGLDAKYLVTQRRNVLESYDDFSLDDLLNELKWITAKHDGKYEPFCFVSEQYIISLLDGFDNPEELEESEEKEFLAL